MRTRTVAVALVALATNACDQRAAFERFIPKDDAAFAIDTFEQLRRHEFETVEARIDKSVAIAATRSRLEEVAAVLGAETAQDVRVIGAWSNTVNGSTTYVNLTLEYRFSQRWLVAAMALHRTDTVRTIDGLNVQPTVDSQEHLTYGPWFLALGVPIGAVVFLRRRRQWPANMPLQPTSGVPILIDSEPHG